MVSHQSQFQSEWSDARQYRLPGRGAGAETNPNRWNEMALDRGEAEGPVRAPMPGSAVAEGYR